MGKHARDDEVDADDDEVNRRVDDGAAAAATDDPTPTPTPRSIATEGPGARIAASDAQPRAPRPPRPPRPAMSLETPPPLPVEVPRAKTVSFARIACFLSLGLATATVLFAAFSNGARRTVLEALIRPLAPDQDAATITALASLLFWATLGVLVAVTIAELAVASRVLSGRGGARWALLGIVLIPHVAAWLLADAFVAIDDGGLLLTVLLVAQWLAVAAATTALLLPDSADWFRAKREARAAALA